MNVRGDFQDCKWSNSQDCKVVVAFGGQMPWPYGFSVMLQCHTSGELQVRRLWMLSTANAEESISWL